jgi:hypothetical protein
MPHLSKNKITATIKKKVDTQLVSFLEHGSSLDRKKMFVELLTNTERMMVGKRLFTIFLLEEGVSAPAISDVLKLSPSTVARYKLNYENGKYVHLRKLVSRKNFITIYKEILKPFMIPFLAQHKSLNRLIKEF